MPCGGRTTSRPLQVLCLFALLLLMTVIVGAASHSEASVRHRGASNGQQSSSVPPWRWTRRKDDPRQPPPPSRRTVIVEQQRAIQEIPTLEELLDNAIVGDVATTVCALNDNGLYGADAVGADAEQQVKVVSYLYQISVVPGTSLLDGTILEELDAAIPTAVLPLLFPNNCAVAGGESRRRHLQDNGGGGTVQAVSQMPDDELVMDGCKYSIISTKSSCLRSILTFLS